MEIIEERQGLYAGSLFEKHMAKRQEYKQAG